MKRNHIFSRIKDLREDNDFTQSQVAEKLGLYTTQYRRYETGESEVPAYIIKELCELYNVSADYMLGITNEFKMI
jgi:transcriptional regulator with XRE-family HTH domain